MHFPLNTTHMYLNIPRSIFMCICSPYTHDLFPLNSHPLSYNPQQAISSYFILPHTFLILIL